MAKASPTQQSLALRVGVAVLLLIVAWMVLNVILGWIWSLIRVAVLLGILGIVAWFVLIGPPGSDD